MRNDTRPSAAHMVQLRRHAVSRLMIGAACLSIATTATACSDKSSPEPTRTASASASSKTMPTETSQTPSTTQPEMTPTSHEAAPKVRKGGTPRIGQLCPNQAGEVRVGANGQELRCSTVGDSEVWTDQTPSTTGSGASTQTWIPMTPSAPPQNGTPGTHSPTSEAPTSDAPAGETTTGATSSPHSTTTQTAPGETTTEGLRAPGAPKGPSSDPAEAPNQ
nr:hypothetical protein [Corynebacterium lactis]